MKSFKLALLTIATALVLQGCNDDNDGSSSTSPPDQSDIDTNIVGFWSEDDANGNLSAISFMDDGTYVQVQVNNGSLVDEPEGGLEWGKYSINSKTGKLTTTQLFDENGGMGLSDAPNLSAHVSNGKLVIEVDENENGSIDSDEQYKFSEIKPNGIVGAWSFDDADDDELIGVAFLDDDTYVHVQVDSNRLLDNPENGLEWGTYAINPSTNQLTTNQTFDSNGGTGLSEPRTRYARVTNEDTVLTIDVDDDSLTFSRTAVKETVDEQMLSGLWRMDLGNEELVTLSFLDDGTYVQTQVTGTTSSRGSDNGIEWGEYSLKANGEFKVDNIIFDTNGSSGLSDDVLRTVRVSGDTLTLGVDEDDDGVIEQDDNEVFTFSKAKSENELGIWRASPSEVDDELILFAFLEDNTFMHIEIDEEAPFDVWDDAPSGLEWNQYTLSNDGVFNLGQSLYSGTNEDLSSFYQMTMDVSEYQLRFTMYEDQDQINEDDGEFVNFFRQ